jgi:hypothetical protein
MSDECGRDPCAALESQRHRRALDDLGEPGALLRVEISFDSHGPRHRRFALVLHQSDVDMQCPQWPALALAYIRRVIEVQPHRAAHSSSSGVGPVSPPPSSAGSSALNAWRPAVIETA